MPTTDFPDIESVAVDIDYCHQCGTTVEPRELKGREMDWCDECEHYLSRIPVLVVHVVVHDDEWVLVLDEPIPQHEGLWSLLGGFASHDEPPRSAGLRELEEETALRGGSS